MSHHRSADHPRRVHRHRHPHWKEPSATARRTKQILVDAANVAFTNHDQPGDRGSVDNLIRMRRALVNLGYEPVFIADASLRHEVDHPEELDALEQSGQILQAPAGTQADYFLLALAEREHLPIVSNDVFRDRRREFPDASQRRVPFMIIDGEVILDLEHLHHAHARRPST